MVCNPAASPVFIQRKSHNRRGADGPYLDYPRKSRKADKRQTRTSQGEKSLQSTMYQKQSIDVSAAPWAMHEFLPVAVSLRMV